MSVAPQALFVLGQDSYNRIYGDELRRRFAEFVDLRGGPLSREEALAQTGLLRDTQIILSGWGGPRVDAEFLAAAPKLDLVLYGAGSVRGIVSDAMWDRGVRICSAYGANGIPVAEYTVAQIILSLKKMWQQAARLRQRQGGRLPIPGTYGSTVGVISLGLIGAEVCRRLQAHDLKVVAYDPFVPPERFAQLGATSVGLAELFAVSDVVSCHTPNLEATRGLLTGEHFAAMKEGATFINTARGAVVREDELIAVLQQRPDLFALLDVTYPHEPPLPESPLYQLPNVILTPHIAGSLDGECRRLGEYMLAELQRYLAGQNLEWEITREQAAIMA